MAGDLHPKVTAGIRVAFLAPSLQRGGAERQMLILAATLPRPSFDVRFLLMSEGGPLADEAAALGVPLHILGLRPEDCRGFDPRCPLRAGQALARYRNLTRDVDIVDAWLVPAFTFAGLARPIVRVPVLLGGRRSQLGLYRSRPWYRRAAAALATRALDAVVANSAAAAREAVIRERIDPGRVHVIRNAVIPVQVPPAEVALVRAAWGFTADHVVVGCVANYRRGKGLESVVDIARTLAPREPRLRYVLIGEGPLRGWLEQAIRDRGLQGVVVLHGGEEDARRLYHSFDIALQASETEGLPNAVLEAAAAGRPIVATDVGGTSEVVSPDREAILVSRDDTSAMAQALACLAADPVLRTRLGSAARERAEAFSPESLAQATAALYLKLLGRP